MDYDKRKRLESIHAQDKAQQELKQRNKEYKDLEDRYNALRTMNEEQDKVIKDLLARYDKECYNVTVNGNWVTEIIDLPSYRSYLPLQEIEGYDMNKIKQFMQMPLYHKIPFVYVQDRQLRIDKTQYNKFLGGLI